MAPVAAPLAHRSTPAQVTEAMVRMNKTVNIPSIQKIMVNFQVENERAEMTQEVMGDMLDDAMAEDGDSDEEEKIVGAVLDEIGISFGDTIPDAPDAMAARPQAAPAAVAVADAGGGGGPPPPPGGGNTTVSDLEARLNNLRK